MSRKKLEKPRVRLTWHIDEELVQKAREVAKKRDMSLQMILKESLVKALEELVKEDYGVFSEV